MISQPWAEKLVDIYRRLRDHKCWEEFALLYESEDIRYWSELDRMSGRKPFVVECSESVQKHNPKREVFVDECPF